MYLPSHIEKIKQERAENRDALLARLAEQIEGDQRICSAWMFGSFGRGEQDCWSDLDVVIVVEDDCFEQFLAERYEMAGQLGEVVLSFESSHNSPPGGTCLMTGYQSPTGMLLIDWYWQPRSVAVRAATKHRIVDRLPVAEAEDPMEGQIAVWQRAGSPKPLGLWNPTEAEDRIHCGMLAWAMIAIQAKYVARHPEEESLGFQEFIENLIARALSRDDAPIRFSEPADRMERLMAIATSFASWAPHVSKPAESVIRLLETVGSLSEPIGTKTRP